MRVYINLRADSAIYMPLCPEKIGKLRCEGHGQISCNMLERAEIRAGQPKEVNQNFSCGHPHQLILSA